MVFKNDVLSYFSSYSNHSPFLNIKSLYGNISNIRSIRQAVIMKKKDNIKKVIIGLVLDEVVRTLSDEEKRKKIVDYVTQFKKPTKNKKKAKNKTKKKKTRSSIKKK